MRRHLPSSKPLATPEKLHTAVQKNSQGLKISDGQALTASTVAFTRLGFFPMMSCLMIREVSQGKLARSRRIKMSCQAGQREDPFISGIEHPMPKRFFLEHKAWFASRNAFSLVTEGFAWSMQGTNGLPLWGLTAGTPQIAEGNLRQSEAPELSYRFGSGALTSAMFCRGPGEQCCYSKESDPAETMSKHIVGCYPISEVPHWCISQPRISGH